MQHIRLFVCFLEFINSSGWGGGEPAYLSLIGRRRCGRLFEAGRLLTFSAFRMGAYSRWALIRGWALIRINTVISYFPIVNKICIIIIIIIIIILSCVDIS